jgi:hypothetical protein
MYFQALIKALNGALIELVVIEGAGSPITLKDKAKELVRAQKIRRSKANSFEGNDQIWVVFDEDQHPNVPRAIAESRDLGIGVAYSNPCFELWLMLHIQDFDQPLDHRDIQRDFKKVCPSYDSAARKALDCTDLLKNLSQAELRAEKQLERRMKEAPIGGAPNRPFTTAFKLTRAIGAAHRAFRGTGIS